MSLTLLLPLLVCPLAMILMMRGIADDYEDHGQPRARRRSCASCGRPTSRSGSRFLRGYYRCPNWLGATAKLSCCACLCLSWGTTGCSASNLESADEA
jgi:Protein of unknown function (DUF2933)